MRTKLAFALLLFTATTAMAAAPAPQYQCTLSSDLLRAYHDGGATANDFAAVRRALWPFIEHCPNGPADRASRKVLFDLIDAEFGMGVDIRREFDPADDRDHAAARDEGIRYTRRDLRAYLDAIVTPADLEFKHTILSYGRPLAISKLGPAVRDDVVRNATTPTGVVYAYMTTTAQQEALGALGYWIDPANGNFSGAEKSKFTAILLAYLDHVPATGASVSDKSLLLEVIHALGRSDSAAVETALRNFTSKHADADLLRAAQKAASAVHGRR